MFAVEGILEYLVWWVSNYFGQSTYSFEQILLIIKKLKQTKSEENKTVDLLWLRDWWSWSLFPIAYDCSRGSHSGNLGLYGTLSELNDS